MPEFSFEISISIGTSFGFFTQTGGFVCILSLACTDIVVCVCGYRVNLALTMTTGSKVQIGTPKQRPK